MVIHASHKQGWFFLSRDSIVYERVSHNKVAVTYVTSAVWHGFYPGYYLFALASLPYNLAERKVRAHIVDHIAAGQMNRWGIHKWGWVGSWLTDAWTDGKVQCIYMDGKKNEPVGKKGGVGGGVHGLVDRE